MRKRNSYVIDKQDKKMVQLFAELGMPKNLAKTLLYVSQVPECLSKDVERGAGLRQPEVSVAMQELCRRGWTEKRDQKKKGKGRPIHIYKSTKELSEIVKSFEQEKMEEVEGVKKDLSELKNMAEKKR